MACLTDCKINLMLDSQKYFLNALSNHELIKNQCICF